MTDTQLIGHFIIIFGAVMLLGFIPIFIIDTIQLVHNFRHPDIYRPSRGHIPPPRKRP